MKSWWKQLYNIKRTNILITEILSYNCQYKDYCAYVYRLIYTLHSHSIFNFIYIHEYMNYYFSVLVFKSAIIMPKWKQKLSCSRKSGKPAFLSQISVPPFTICALFTQKDFLIPKDWFCLLPFCCWRGDSNMVPLRFSNSSIAIISDHTI